MKVIPSGLVTAAAKTQNPIHSHYTSTPKYFSAYSRIGLNHTCIFTSVLERRENLWFCSRCILFETLKFRHINMHLNKTSQIIKTFYSLSMETETSQNCFLTHQCYKINAYPCNSQEPLECVVFLPVVMLH